jgi:hypothetical protein
VDGRLPLDFSDVKRSIAQLRVETPGQLFVVGAMRHHPPLMERHVVAFVARQQLCLLSAKSLLFSGQCLLDAAFLRFPIICHPYSPVLAPNNASVPIFPKKPTGITVIVAAFPSGGQT